MIKKTAGMLLSASLLLGTAACGTADNAADDRDNRLNILGNDNLGDGKDEGIDHNGPLTRDYNDNSKDNDRDMNKFDDRKEDNDYDLDVDNRVSSYQTSMDSGRYPQTKAVLIEEAKYQFVPCQPGEDTGAAQQAPPPVQPGSLQQDTGIGNQQGPKATEPGIGNQPAPAPAPAPAPTQPQTGTDNKANTSASKYVQQVIDLTNEQRTKNGLPALKGDAKLSSVAQKKSADMQQKGYFSHTSPTYGSPFDMMRDFGVSYRSAGENIAQGQQTPQEVVNAWMNSEGHRKNILSRDFTHIGVGYEAAGNYWTQMFIGK